MDAGSKGREEEGGSLGVEEGVADVPVPAQFLYVCVRVCVRARVRELPSVRPSVRRPCALGACTCARAFSCTCLRACSDAHSSSLGNQGMDGVEKG